MKKIFLLSAITLCTFAFFSCSKDDTVKEELEFEHLGIWEGTYSGDDEGTWELTVDVNGDFEGTMASDVLPATSSFSGSVNDSGVVKASIIHPLGKGTMKGQMKDGRVTGTWVATSQNLGGVLDGAKK